MQVGDLVKHTIHTGNIGLITDTANGEVLVNWLTNDWGEHWILLMYLVPLEVE